MTNSPFILAEPQPRERMRAWVRDVQEARGRRLEAVGRSAALPDEVPADPQAAERKFAWLKRLGLFGSDLKGTTIERACAPDDLVAAYRLVHDTYVESGYLLPQPAGIRLRCYEASADTATFVAKKDGEVVAVLSVVMDSPDLGLPSEEAFGGEIDLLRRRGWVLSELSNQAVAEPYRRSAVPTELMRCAVAHAMAAGVDEALATVSPSHTAFYDLMGFRTVGTERSYSDELEDPVVCLSLELARLRRLRSGATPVERQIHAYGMTDNPHWRSLFAWDAEARAKMLAPETQASLAAEIEENC